MLARALLLLDDVAAARTHLGDAARYLRQTSDAVVLGEWLEEASKEADSGRIGPWAMAPDDGGAAVASLPPDAPQLPGDRRTALRLDQHGQDAGPVHLPQAWRLLASGGGRYRRRGRIDRNGEAASRARSNRRTKVELGPLRRGDDHPLWMTGGHEPSGCEHREITLFGGCRCIEGTIRWRVPSRRLVAYGDKGARRPSSMSAVSPETHQALASISIGRLESLEGSLGLREEYRVATGSTSGRWRWSRSRR